MKIKRYDALCGTFEFELTNDELVAAYWEQQHNFDLEDVRSYFENQWKESCDGLDATEEELAYIGSHMGEIARSYRRIEENDRTSDWWDSAEQAINEALKERRERK